MLPGGSTEPARNAAELERLLNNVIRVATVVQVNHQVKKFRASDGALEFGWLDMPCVIGRNRREWMPMRVGTQVIITSPGGDTKQGKCIGMLYTNTLNSPSDDPNIDLIEWNDGAKIEYNIATGDMHIKAMGKITHEAKHHFIKGGVTQTGGDMTSDGVSAQHHKHGKVVPGPANTDEPVK